jgi:outer membrane protein OmpA-like peptidoglycan-associated protein
MKTTNLKMFMAATTTALLLGACSTQLAAPEGSADARARLMVLQANPELASRAPIEIRDAGLAVSVAERPERDADVARHRVLIADQKVEIAGAWAQSRLYEDQRTALSAEAESARLASRTREADLARSDARTARNEADVAQDAAAAARSQTQAARNDASSARTAADIARGQAAVAVSEADSARTDASVARNQTDLARRDTAAAQAETAELQRQISELNARTTDRGLIVTLGDVLFETGNSNLRAGIAGNLDNLVAFLNRYPERTVIIEGHTDSVGTESSNMGLSQRRADSVQAYLISRGIAGTRLSSSGKGELSPISDNETTTGRQQNRRVEVVISNPPLTRL